MDEKIEMHGIGWAVKQMQNSNQVTRLGWNGRDMWIAIENPDEESDMDLSYVYMRTVNGNLIPWLCSQSDLLATDWQLA